MSEADLALVVVASLVGSFIKSVTGMGFPLVAIPFLSLFIDVETAVVVIAAPNVTANLLLNIDARDHRHETRDLPVLAMTSIVGAVAGTLLLVQAPEEPLMLGLALSIVLFVAQVLRSPDYRLSVEASRRWAPVSGTVAGFSQGAIGVSGPIVAMWFHGYRLAKDAYVFSVTTLFFISGAAQLSVLAADGQFDRDRATAAALSLIAALAVMPLGTRLRTKIGGATFERLVLGLLCVSAVSLVVRALL